tara:strand:+ start:681 stop:1448 length:768 start_codon:yes stop_codon:yes gene_type:complete
MDEYVGNEFPGYSAPMPKHGHKWVDILQNERGQTPMIDVAYMATMCNHCDDAPCIKAAKNGAVSKRDDGIVLIDPVKAKGQRQIVKACPYGSVYWNEELEIPQAWTFDAHLLDQGWKQPRCGQSCPTAAMRAVKVSDAEMSRIVDEQDLEVLKPELGTKPRVYYKNLKAFTHCFIGGTVSQEIGSLIDCVEGAGVVLKQQGELLKETITDAYGDFKFDELPPDSGKYEIVVTADSASKTVEATLGMSLNLGEIRI